MISEVLLLMITCILIRISSTEVKWTVLDTSPKLGQGLTLFCKVDNCAVDGTKRWQGGPEDKVLMFHSGISTDKAKYSTSIGKNGFILTILNLTFEYLNVCYECSCGTEYDKHILYIEDIFTDLITDANTEEESTISISEKEDFSIVDNLNKTTNGTNYVGTHVAGGVILPIIITIILAIVLIIVIGVFKKYGLCKILKEKVTGTQRQTTDISNLEPPIFPPVHEPTDGSSLQSVNLSSIQCTEDDYGQTVTDPLIQATRVDSNTRQSSDEDDGQNVTDPFLQNTHVDSNLRQSSDICNLEPPIFPPVHEPTDGSSLTSVDVHVTPNPIQCTDEDDGQNVTDPFLQNTHVDSNLRQSSDICNLEPPIFPPVHEPTDGSSLTSVDVHVTPNPIQCTEDRDHNPRLSSCTVHVDENPRQSSDDKLHGNELLQQPQESINRITESIEPSISREASSKIVEVKQIGVSTLPFQRTGFSITDTEKRESPETNSHLLPSKPDSSFPYSIRDDPACPEKRYKYADIKLRELSFKTWPLNKPTIVQLVDAGFFQSGDTNIAICFSCGNTIYCNEGQDPLHEAFHNNCEYLRQITITSTQLKTACSSDQ